MKAIAYDSVTGKKVIDVTLKLKITFTSNSTTKEIVGHDGEVTYSTEIEPNSKNGNISFTATVQASALGYRFKKRKSETGIDVSPG
jgi:hypothetical protein